MKNKCFIGSFKNAMSGIIETIKNERNMRIHLSVFNLIIIFAYFYGLSRAEWAVLMLTCGCVIGAELINTAIENAVDTSTDKICETARVSKDSAAGAVLFLAMTSILVGIMLFFDVDKCKLTFTSWLGWEGLSPLVKILFSYHRDKFLYRFYPSLRKRDFPYCFPF